MEAERSFETWITIASTMIDSLEDFEPFYDELERIINSIINTGNLPTDIDGDLGKFIISIRNDFVKKLLRLGTLQEPEYEIAQKFVQLVLRLGNYGIENDKEEMVQLVEDIIGSARTQTFFTRNTYKQPEVYFPKYCATIGMYNNVINLMRKKPTTIMTLSLILNISIRISTFIPEYNFWEVSYTASNAMLEIIKASKIRETPTNVVENIFNALLSNAIAQPVMNQQFILQWIEILSFFIHTEFFEKRLFGFKLICRLIETRETKIIAVDLLSQENRYSIFDGTVIHEEFMPIIGSCLRTMCSLSKCPIELLEKLFSLNSLQHSSELPRFYGMFSMMAQYIDLSIIERFTKLILNPNEPSEPWYQMIKQVAVAYGRRPEAKASFILIRDAMFQLRARGDSGATDVLSSIMQYHITNEEFQQYLNQLTQPPITVDTFKLISEMCQAFPVEDPNKRNELMSHAIALVLSEKNTEPVYGFLFNFCFVNEIPLTEETAGAIFAMHPSDNGALLFLEEMLSSELISKETVELLLDGAQDSQVDDALVRFALNYVKSQSQYKGVLTALPIPGEAVLWNLAARNTKNTEAAVALVDIYASNDGVLLTDTEMINAFLARWMSEESKTPNKAAMLTLLRQFIKNIENSVDISFYGLHRHSVLLQSDPVRVEVKGIQISQQIYDLPPLTTVAALMDRVSRFTRIPVNAFKLEKPYKVVKVTDIVKVHADKENVARFSFITIDPAHQTPLRHTRTTLPSLIIAKSPAVATIIKLLKEGLTEAVMLLDLLPTLPATHLKIKEIGKKPEFDYAEFLPLEYPMLFMYNFDGLSTSYDDELRANLLKTKGFSYILQCLAKDPESAVGTKIVSFLTKRADNEIKKEIAEEAVNLLMPILANLTLSTQKNRFCTISNLLKHITTIEGDFCIKLNESNNENIGFLLNAVEDHVRVQTDVVLEHVTVSQKVLTELAMKEGAAPEVFVCLDKHITEQDDTLTAFIRDEIEKKTSLAALKLFSKLLSKGFVDERTKAEVSECLASKFLVIDEKARDKDTLTAALGIIAEYPTPKILAQIEKIHSEKHCYEKWGIDGDNSAPKSGFVGLVNLGATCFLNSTLQQFFMMPDIRQKVLEYDGTNEFMLELRGLFARLALSKRSAVSTEKLVNKWVGWDGEPMNPRIQQDACEFIQILIDKLEEGLGVKYIHDLFQGTTVSTIEGLTEEYKSESSDYTYTLTLPVKDCGDMTEAIQKMGQPDFFHGDNQYKPEGFDHKIDAKKYLSIGQLQPHLIIQLCRFDFNYATLERVKINSKFEFPVDIDFAPFTNIKQETKFHLHGIVMHFGSAQFGHYVSYVRERKKDGKWFCFNDSSVTPIDEETVLKAAFGTDQGRSGYILFYDRDDVDYTTYSNDLALQTKLPDSLIKAIDNENALNDEYRLLCSSSYNAMMAKFAECKTNDGAVLAAARYFFDTQPHTFHAKTATAISEAIVKHAKETDFSKKLPEAFKELDLSILKTPGNLIRDGVRNLVTAADPASIPDELVEQIFGLLDIYVENYRTGNQLMEVIVHLVKNGRLDSKRVAERVLKIIQEEIPKYLKENNQIRREYFFAGLDFSAGFEAISLAPPMSDWASDDILTGVLQSMTNVKPFVLALKKIDPNVGAQLRKYAELNSIYINYFRMCLFLAMFFGPDYFEIADGCHFKVMEKPVGPVEEALRHVYLTHEPSLQEMYMKEMDRWLMPSLIDDTQDARVSIMNAVSNLAPLKEFEERLILPTSECLRGLGEVLVPRNGGDEAEKRGLIILKYLLNQRETVVKCVTEAFTKSSSSAQSTYIASQYIDLLKVLVEHATEIDVTQIEEILDGLIPTMKPFDIHVKSLIELLVSLNSSKLRDYSRLMLHTGTITVPIYQRMLNMLKAFLPFLENTVMDGIFVSSFIETYAFPNRQKLAFQNAPVYSMCRRFAQTNREAVCAAMYKLGINECIQTNFGSALTLMSLTGLKGPVLNYLAGSMNQREFNNDELVKLAFDCDDGSETVNSRGLLELLNMQALLPESRNRIWEFVIREHTIPSREFAGAYTFRGDYAMLARYVIAECGGNDCYDILMDASSNDTDALTVSIDVLESKFKDHLTPEYCKSVLSNPIKTNAQACVKLAHAASSNGKKEGDHLVGMKPVYEIIKEHSEYIKDVTPFVSDADLDPLMGPLEMVSKVHFTGSGIEMALCALQYSLSKVDPKTEKISAALRLLRMAILV